MSVPSEKEKREASNKDHKFLEWALENALPAVTLIAIVWFAVLGGSPLASVFTSYFAYLLSVLVLVALRALARRFTRPASTRTRALPTTSSDIGFIVSAAKMGLPVAIAIAIARFAALGGSALDNAIAACSIYLFLVGLALAARLGKMFFERRRFEIAACVFVCKLATNMFFAACARRAKRTKLALWLSGMAVPEARQRGKFFTLDYRLEGQQYCLVVSAPEQPWLFTVTDQEGRDQSRVVGPALGPDANFHGALLTPRDFGFETLTILCLGCDPMQKTFTSDEILVIDKKLKSRDVEP